MAKARSVQPKAQPVNIDLDALMGEVYKETRSLKIFGQIYHIPAEIPARLVTQHQRLTRKTASVVAEHQRLQAEVTAVMADDTLSEEERTAQVDTLLAQLETLDVPTEDDICNLYQEIIDFACGAGTFDAWMAKGAGLERLAIAATAIVNKQLDDLRDPFGGTAAGSHPSSTTSAR